MIDPAVLRRQKVALLENTLSRYAEFGLEPAIGLRLKRPPIDGKRFGHMVVLGILGRRTMPSGLKRIHVLCRCDCGREFHADIGHVREGMCRRCWPCANTQAAARERRKSTRLPDGRLLSEAARTAGLPASTVYYRIRRGWPQARWFAPVVRPLPLRRAETT